jgi:uncharacterized protein (DUF342 family)
MRPQKLDLEVALRRAVEREESLLWNLKELLVSLDESTIGPAVNIIPRWQLERIENAIESSEEEVEMLHEALAAIEEWDNPG